ncbi:glycosyltransferase family 2 protein [Candidatus Shapirobacteria bacterium]|nr:glycosyltransferase family 2 protein [Candidatus Shapirobacteria bacterium]
MRLGVVIIAKNEEKMIGEAIKSAKFADEVIVYLSPKTTDKTELISRKMGCRIVEQKGVGYGQWRTNTIKEVKNNWLFYLDADERFTPKLAKEIKKIIKNKKRLEPTVYAVPRANYYLGKRVKHGGSWPDYVERFFLKSSLIKWTGELHERPVYKGKLGYLKNPITHLTHRDLTSMVEKTIKWTNVEADLLFKAKHPPVVAWRIFRMMFTKFWERVIKQGAWKDGAVGWINSIFETFNTFIIYARLWEKQQKKL